VLISTMVWGARMGAAGVWGKDPLQESERSEAGTPAWQMPGDGGRGGAGGCADWLDGFAYLWHYVGWLTELIDPKARNPRRGRGWALRSEVEALAGRPEPTVSPREG